MKKQTNIDKSWGFVLLWRKLKKTSFASNPLTLALFIHLLLSANHEDREIIFNKKPLLIKKGQLVTGLLSLQKNTGISIQSLRTGLVSLQNSNTITRKVTNKFSIISICNWEEYQLPPTHKLTIKQQSSNNQATTNNNDVLIKNNYIYKQNFSKEPEPPPLIKGEDFIKTLDEDEP